MIEIKNLTKSYKTPVGRHFVFQNVNLILPDGKSVGFLGRNGAGKSTLLRIIGGMDKPDTGEVLSNGRISWPVGLASGFQGSMTGRQNVKFVARLYANQDELKEKIAFVEEFAQLGKYFDMPIKSYSSGMKSRLGFGLSMAFDFDYYLVDEVTAVGDASFRKRSADLIQEKRKASQFLMVSHNLNEIKKFCDIAVLVGRSGVELFTDVDAAIDAYKQDEQLK